MSTAQLPLLPELADLPAEFPENGILPSQMLEEMICNGEVKATSRITPDQIQPASLDLRLGTIAHRVRASFLPGKKATVPEKLQKLTMAELDLSKPALLEKGGVYIVPLQEELSLPSRISARANPKSSTGRLDIFTRLLTNYGTEFDEIYAGYRGKLYVEIAPLTFPIILHEGIRLNQLRVRKGEPEDSDMMLRKLNKRAPILYSQDRTPAQALIDDGLRLGVDLQGVEGAEIIGYRAKSDVPAIDLSRVNYYDVREYWEPLRKSTDGTLVLNHNEFYILTSTKKVSIPPEYAAEMLPFDPAMGEFRIHYAGFFDPGFGWSPGEPSAGSHAVLEVRSHDVPLLLQHDQVVARLIYEPLLGRPGKLYGGGIGSNYQGQHLALSKHFRKD